MTFTTGKIDTRVEFIEHFQAVSLLEFYFLRGIGATDKDLAIHFLLWINHPFGNNGVLQRIQYYRDHPIRLNQRSSLVIGTSFEKNFGAAKFVGSAVKLQCCTVSHSSIF